MHRWHRKRRISSRLRSWKTESLLFDLSINRLIVLIQICLFCLLNIKLLKLHSGHNGASVISKCLLLLLNNLLCKIKIWESVSSGRSGSGCHGVTAAQRRPETSSCSGMNWWDFNGRSEGCKRQRRVERYRRRPPQSGLHFRWRRKVGDGCLHSCVEPFTGSSAAGQSPLVLTPVVSLLPLESVLSFLPQVCEVK